MEVNLWHFLGEIYRTRMQQFEAAAEAFKMASNLEPDNAMRHEILAELYLKFRSLLHPILWFAGLPMIALRGFWKKGRELQAPGCSHFTGNLWCFSFR